MDTINKIKLKPIDYFIERINGLSHYNRYIFDFNVSMERSGGSFFIIESMSHLACRDRVSVFFDGRNRMKTSMQGFTIQDYMIDEYIQC